jgi:protein disulfide-isomerase A1
VQTWKSILHYFATSSDEKEAYSREMGPLAKKYAESVHFTITDPNEYSKLGAHGKSRLALEDTDTGDIFPFPEGHAITSEAVEGFVEGFMSRSLRPQNPGEEGGEDKRGHDEL